MPYDATRKRILVATPLVVVLLAMGIALVVAGVWFAAWPASLADAGFHSDPSALRRVTGLFFFGGSGVAMLLMGYGLLRSWPFAWRRFDHAATVIALTAIGVIWRHPSARWFASVALIACATSLILYRRLRRELPDHLDADGRRRPNQSP